MRLVSFLFSSAILVATSLAGSIDPLATRADLWSLNPGTFGQEFVAQYREDLQTKPFRWVSEAKDSARAAERDLTLFSLPVVEMLARFEGDKLTQLTAVFYARGDAGDLPKEKYEALVRAAVDSLNRATGARMTVRGRDATNAVKADGLIWQTPTAQFLLEYSATKEVKTRDIRFRAEFVRLEITPAPQRGGLLTSAPAAAKGKFRGTDHVERDTASGDVVIRDVPMVDQGDKGYCAVACAERVMRYYAVPVDANELAQVANSDAERGTSGRAMMEALKKLGARLRVRVRTVESMEVKDILALMADYNRAAKKESKPLIPEQGQMLDLGVIYTAMDPELLRTVRNKNKADVSRFQRDVQAHVDSGVPLLWAVRLGLLPEQNAPQGSGGHMRLIIGYNLKTQELIYTDSWGAGHERKRMPLADAWTITVSLASIEPL